MKEVMIMGMEDVRTDVNVWDINLERQIVVLKPESLKEEFRCAKYQLVKCIGGFGCNPSSMGNAIFVQELHNDNPETYRRERCNRNFLGVATDEAIGKFMELYGKEI